MWQTSTSRGQWWRSTPPSCGCGRWSLKLELTPEQDEGAVLWQVRPAQQWWQQQWRLAAAVIGNEESHAGPCEVCSVSVFLWEEREGGRESKNRGPYVFWGSTLATIVHKWHSTNLHTSSYNTPLTVSYVWHGVMNKYYVSKVVRYNLNLFGEEESKSR